MENCCLFVFTITLKVSMFISGEVSWKNPREGKTEKQIDITPSFPWSILSCPFSARSSTCRSKVIKYFVQFLSHHGTAKPALYLLLCPFKITWIFRYFL